MNSLDKLYYNENIKQHIDIDEDDEEIDDFDDDLDIPKIDGEIHEG